MKAATKAKRRVTLAFSGLGFLDESEIPGAQRNRPETISKEQIKALKSYATEVDADIPAFLDFISDRWELDIGKLADIPATHVDDAMAMLKRKADAYAAAQKQVAADAEQPEPATGMIEPDSGDGAELAHDPATGDASNAG
jgi:hypothetical protein